MLLGEYEHTLDDKNRLTLPAKFRSAMADGVVLTRGLDSCVEAYPLGDWTDLVERELSGSTPQPREPQAGTVLLLRRRRGAAGQAGPRDAAADA